MLLQFLSLLLGARGTNVSTPEQVTRMICSAIPLQIISARTEWHM